MKLDWIYAYLFYPQPENPQLSQWCWVLFLKHKFLKSWYYTKISVFLEELLLPRKQIINWFLKGCSFGGLNWKYSLVFWAGEETLHWYLFLFLLFFHIILALQDYISLTICIVNVGRCPLKSQPIFFGFWNYELRRKREKLYFFPSL